MFQTEWRVFASIVILLGSFVQNQAPTAEEGGNHVVLEVIRNSWDFERDETLVYLRIYSNGLAEAHPMRKIDFRNIELKNRRLSDDQLTSLRSLLRDPTTAALAPKYSSHWGEKDSGYKWDITISNDSEKKLLELENFQPFLARKQGKQYPKQLEKLGCSIWKLRAEVTGEALEKQWLRGCQELGY